MVDMSHPPLAYVHLGPKAVTKPVTRVVRRAAMTQMARIPTFFEEEIQAPNRYIHWDMTVAA
jgi:hypothetical protein